MDSAEDGYKGRTKKEILMLTRERTKLERVLGGIAEMHKVPSALWIVDTNCDPDVVDYPIPGNDDAIRSTGLLSKIISTAVIEGKKARSERELAAAKEAAGDTPATEETVEVAAKVEAPAEVAAEAAE